MTLGKWDVNRVYCCEALELLRGLPDNSVSCIVTSPPYFGLRSYTDDDEREIGKEETPEEYVAALVGVFREARRVLRKDGGRLRDLLVLLVCGGNTPLVELGEQSKEEETARAKKFDPAGIVHMIALCENIQRSAKSSAVPRALLDALIVRMALTDKFADVTALVAGGGQLPAKKR